MAGTHCTYPPRSGQAELTGWLVTYLDECPVLVIGVARGCSARKNVEAEFMGISCKCKPPTIEGESAPPPSEGEESFLLGGEGCGV